VINSLLGAAAGIGLYLIGLPNAVLWGALVMTLRFIPCIGPWKAAAMTIGLPMAISGEWVAPGLTIGLFVVLELVSNNVLEPWLYGKNTGVSTVAVLPNVHVGLDSHGPVPDRRSGKLPAVVVAMEEKRAVPNIQPSGLRE
jgi:predicted PurR-regulated permease PerM